MKTDFKNRLNGRTSSSGKNRMDITDTYRSTAVQEIISRKASFTETWALLLFLIILFFVFVGSWFIRYPDIIYANATLTAANAPKEIVATQDGKIERLFVDNESLVKQGQMIAWIESTAKHEEVITLGNLLTHAELFVLNGEIERLSNVFNKPFYNLGELQTFYQRFIPAWQQFNDYLINGYYYKRRRGLNQDYLRLKKMHISLEQQLRLMQEDLLLTLEDYDANQSLANEKVISRQEFRNVKSKLVNKQMNIPQTESAILINENEQAGKMREMDELEHSISQQVVIFQQALQTLKSVTEDWMKKYIIKAPADGKVAFIVPLQEDQYMKAGKTIGFVNPGDSRYYAIVTLKQNNFGKLNVGQRVQLHFHAYPHHEYGFVGGKLNYISNVPSDSGFLASIELSNGLITNHNRELQYRSGLKSEALIITSNERLLQRFYFSIVKEFYR